MPASTRRPPHPRTSVYTQPYAEHIFTLTLHNGLSHFKPEVALAVALGCNPPHHDDPPDSFLSSHSFDKNLSCHTYMELPLLYMDKRLLTYLTIASPGVISKKIDPRSSFAIPRPPCSNLDRPYTRPYNSRLRSNSQGVCGKHASLGSP